MKKPTIKDVAAKACVSTALVSRVMNAPLKQNGLPDCVVHPDTARRIINAVAELGYHPNKAAASLRKQLKKRIGVIIPDISNPFFSDIARHIESIARQNGYIVLFGSTDENPEQLGTLTEAFMEDGVDGIIITPSVDSYEQVSKIVARGMPVVIMIRDIPALDGIGRVLTDDIEATTLAINHLMENGFRAIDMISPRRRISNAKHREDFFSAKMDELQLEYRIHHDNSTEGTEDIRLILEDAVRRGVQAVYCTSASIPVRVLQAARELGIRIPEDIALIGYDGGAQYRILSPSISQIEFSREEIAREAFGQLLEMITKGDGCGICKYLRPALVPGGSTCRPSSAANVSPQSAEKLLSALSKAAIAIDGIIRELK